MASYFIISFISSYVLTYTYIWEVFDKNRSWNDIKTWGFPYLFLDKFKPVCVVFGVLFITACVSFQKYLADFAFSLLAMR